MLAISLLASIGRCASSTPCPTDEELVAAVTARDYAVVSAIVLEADAKGEIVLAHPQRIRRVTDVICGEPEPGDPPAITCKFTIRYWRSNSYVVADLVHREDGWEIAKEMRVSRDRR